MNRAGSKHSPPSKPGVILDKSPTGRGYRLEATLVLPQPRTKLFAFFCDAFQLEAITPPWLHFSVISPGPIQIEQGTVINYKLRLHGIPIRWQTRICAWEPPFRFIDEQVRGPYRRWHHEHTFEEIDGGTICRDAVDYEVPGGRLINALFVGSDVRNIFTFRQHQLTQLFAT